MAGAAARLATIMSNWADAATWALPETFASEQGLVRWGRLGTGPPVVLVHGTPFSSWVWRDVAVALAEERTVLVYDLVGFGGSEQGDDQDVSLAAQGRVLAALLAHWGLDRPAVVAHDIGGATALRAHLLHGAAYERLALVDVVAQAPWGSDFYRLVRDNPEVFAQLPGALHEGLLGPYVSSASHRGLSPDTVAAYAAPWLGEAGQAAFYRQIAQGDVRHTDEVEPRYGDLALPVLVCWGDEDTWLPPEKGVSLASTIPGARLQPIRGSGHLVQEDAPAQLTAALTRFLREEG
jgi:pimeloyl-ACP methyl ester carboxylesterase